MISQARHKDAGLVAGLALGLAVLVAGCGDGDAGRFKAYGDLEQDAGTETTEVSQPAPAATASEDAPAGAESATTPADAEPASGDTAAGTTAAVQDAGHRAAEAETPSAAVDPAAGHGDVPAIAEKPLEGELAPVEPRKVEVLVKNRDFQTEEGALRVSYDDIDLLKVLNMEPVTADAPSLMPDWLRHLDGKRIRIRGFMYPPFQETGIEQFILARDNQICCFGRNPKIYDLVEVRMRSGQSTNYIQNRPFDVVGTFHIEPTADLDLLRLYWIDDAMVIER